MDVHGGLRTKYYHSPERTRACWCRCWIFCIRWDDRTKKYRFLDDNLRRPKLQKWDGSDVILLENYWVWVHRSKGCTTFPFKKASFRLRNKILFTFYKCNRFFFLKILGFQCFSSYYWLWMKALFLGRYIFSLYYSVREILLLFVKMIDCTFIKKRVLEIAVNKVIVKI